jgi:hypothetical protein
MCETRNESRMQYASRSPKKTPRRAPRKKEDTSDSVEVTESSTEPIADEAA